MIERISRVLKALCLVLLSLPLCGSLWAQDDNLTTETATYRKEFLSDILFSARFEGLFRHNFRTTVRERTSHHSKSYFNTIYLNAEGNLNSSSEFIVEFQPYVSSLYLLGGFISVARPLEGIGSDPDEVIDARQRLIADIARSSLSDIDAAADYPSAERVQIDYFVNEYFGLRIGRVRNPWGFWDDYSLFRNLSAGKTDPITLGVQLRRADYGLVSYGRNGDVFTYEFGVLTGENTVDDIESNSAKDVVLRLGSTLGRLDVGVNYYHHDLGKGGGPLHAAGVHWRWPATYNLTLLGEYIYAHNTLIDVTTRSFYLQANYNLGELLLNGLRWNTFFESYNSDLLKVDFDGSVDYRYAGTILRGSTGFMYALRRDTDLGAQIIVGADEEGDDTLEMAFKVDLKF